MTTTPPEAPHEAARAPDPEPPPGGPAAASGPRVTREEMRELARLRRSRSDRKIAGVAGGLARHLDIDPVIVRVAVVVLTLFGGAGLLVYGGLWLLVPEEGSERAILGLDDRSRSLAVIGIGVLAALSLVGDSWGFWDFPWFLVVVGVVLALLLSRRKSASSPSPPLVSLTKGTPPPAGTPWQPTGGWQGYVPPPPRPRDPRRRGPILFWFTLALSALAVGVTGMVDVSGVGVPNAAYPAAAVGVCGLMLLVGAFYGRAGGVIALGLLATVALAGAAASDHWDGRKLIETPLSSTAVDSRYQLPVGEIRLDLSAVSDPAALSGESIALEVGVGRLEVILPPGVDVDITAQVGGPGELMLPDRRVDGVSLRESVRIDAPAAPGPPLSLDLSAGVGEIVVTR